MNTLSKEKRIARILILLICIMLTVSILVLICFHYHGDNPSNTTLIADIYQNGALIESIPLHEVTTSYTITIDGDDDCTNIIEVRNGSIGIISADCPDKLCVKQGFINSSLLPITCLPNRVVIQLRTNDGNEDINVY